MRRLVKVDCVGQREWSWHSLSSVAGQIGECCCVLLGRALWAMFGGVQFLYSGDPPYMPEGGPCPFEKKINFLSGLASGFRVRGVAAQLGNGELHSVP